MRQRVPLIYFHGIVEGKCEAEYPSSSATHRRSSLIEQAVRQSVRRRQHTRMNLRKELADSYAVNAGFDRQMSEDWPGSRLNKKTAA